MTDAAMTTHEWARSTGGALTDDQKRVVRSAIRAGYADFARGLVRWPFRRTPAPVEVPAPPDSTMARHAEEAAMDQGPMLAGHGYRTWLAGAALAIRDGADLDPELFYVVSLLHDSGMVTEVVGEDFTIRSAAALIDISEGSGRPEVSTVLADAVVAHTTPGLLADDQPLGFYVQAGAMADLTGLRMWDLPKGYLRHAYVAHPACGVHCGISKLIGVEARNVPDGRFALLQRHGFGLVVRLSPSRLVSARAARGSAVTQPAGQRPPGR